MMTGNLRTMLQQVFTFAVIIFAGPSPGRPCQYLGVMLGSLMGRLQLLLRVCENRYFWVQLEHSALRQWVVLSDLVLRRG